VLAEDGLRRGGAIELADQVSARFRAVCEKSGFAENFDALTGQGLRDRAYTWTASAYLILAGDAETTDSSVLKGDTRGVPDHLREEADIGRQTVHDHRPTGR
jgi:hypothetical protein